MTSAARPVADTIRVEVAYAEPQRQFLRALELPTGSTVAEAIAASGIANEFGVDTQTLDTGIWSRRVAAETVLREGDRVELYRPLRIDPMQARRLRAAKRGQTGR